MPRRQNWYDFCLLFMRYSEIRYIWWCNRDHGLSKREAVLWHWSYGKSERGEQADRGPFSTIWRYARSLNEQ